MESPFFKSQSPDFTRWTEVLFEGESVSKFNVHVKLCKIHQDSVDYIRNNHKRYLRFEP